MKKAIIEAVMTKNNGVNFIIRTNISQGRGINGVDYLSYKGAVIAKDNSYSNDTTTYYSTITELNDDYMVISVSQSEIYPSTSYDVVLPLENIMSIEFIKVATGYRPVSIPKNKLFTAKKATKTTKATKSAKASK